MKESVNTRELTGLIDQWIGKISVLSLDCFDTLIWRTTSSPVDVFLRIDPGVTIKPRILAESRARAMRHADTGLTEVALADVYRGFPGENDEATVHARVAAELQAEHAHCFAFAPTVELIRRAHAAGIKVIVVSDTYLSSEQLRALIRGAVGPAVEAMIDTIFASSAHGLSKAGGLFPRLLPRLGAPPQRILHLGDNRQADFIAAREAGLNALHLEQFAPAVERQLRTEAACASLFEPALRQSRPVYQLHRAALSLVGERSDAIDRGDEPGWVTGYRTLGPIMVAFSHWLRDRIDEARRRNPQGRVHALFLMRDGHLPEQVFSTLFPELREYTRRIEVSRFVAFASSMDCRENVLRYLAEFGSNNRFDALARQLLFDDRETAALVGRAGKSRQPLQTFTAEVLRSANLRKITERSARCAERLLTYLQSQVAVKAGDTVLLIDLGYAGTIQDRIAPLLRARLGVEVEGRYLALRDVPGWRQDKSGLFDPANLDSRAIDSLCGYIALIEQLCTIGQASVTDYEEDGTPIRLSSDLKQRQSEVRTRVQNGCVAFARQYTEAIWSTPPSANADAWRTTALGCLARLLFYPQVAELALFEGFEQDVNLGVDEKLAFFDPASAREAMIRRGLFYVSDSSRLFLPAEVRGLGSMASLSLIALQRFSLDLTHADFNDQPMLLPIMLANGHELASHEVPAIPTHDGYYAATIPCGTGSFAIGVRLGRCFEWVQIHSATLTRADRFLRKGDMDGALDRLPDATFEDIVCHPGGILECRGDDAFLFFPPLQREREQLLTLTFRPLAFRADSDGVQGSDRVATPIASTKPGVPSSAA
jgi:FMN phosphatase YigB (HAD superfamily)